VRRVDVDLLQLLTLLLQARATAPINGDQAQFFKPTHHSLQENVFYVNVQQHRA
jgi:ubiquitin-protein ligase